MATPALLSVPTTTAIMYYGVWAICLTAKILFGYYLLIKPLLLPIDFILSADYNCWLGLGLGIGLGLGLGLEARPALREPGRRLNRVRVGVRVIGEPTLIT